MTLFEFHYIRDICILNLIDIRNWYYISFFIKYHLIMYEVKILYHHFDVLLCYFIVTNMNRYYLFNRNSVRYVHFLYFLLHVPL